MLRSASSLLSSLIKLRSPFAGCHLNGMDGIFIHLPSPFIWFGGRQWGFSVEAVNWFYDRKRKAEKGRLDFNELHKCETQWIKDRFVTFPTKRRLRPRNNLSMPGKISIFFLLVSWIMDPYESHYGCFRHRLRPRNIISALSQAEHHCVRFQSSSHANPSLPFCPLIFIKSDSNENHKWNFSRLCLVRKYFCCGFFVHRQFSTRKARTFLAKHLHGFGVRKLLGKAEVRVDGEETFWGFGNVRLSISTWKLFRVFSESSQDWKRLWSTESFKSLWIHSTVSSFLNRYFADQNGFKSFLVSAYTIHNKTITVPLSMHITFAQLLLEREILWRYQLHSPFE